MIGALAAPAASAPARAAPYLCDAIARLLIARYDKQ